MSHLSKASILHVITSLGDGGAESTLFHLCCSDTENRHHVVSLMDTGKYGASLTGHGVAVTTLDMPRGRITLSGLWRLWALLRREKPDAVQTWMYHADLLGGLAARLAGIRNINWGIHHTTLVPGQNRAGTILVAKICARLSRLIPRNIICCAQKAVEVHVKLGYDAQRMRVIPNGYDLTLYQPDREAGKALRRALGLSEQEKVIGFVARYDPLKDHDNLLRALEILKQRGTCPRCLLVGTGLDVQNEGVVTRLRNLELMDHVLLLGRRSDIPAVMNALNLHVMSSASEAFPNVLAEAMACGTPCVTTDVGDAAAILGGTGRVVPPNDSAALADAIASLLDERGTPDWDARCDSAREHIVANFSIEQMVNSYRSIWNGT